MFEWKPVFLIVLLSTAISCASGLANAQSSLQQTSAAAPVAVVSRQDKAIAALRMFRGSDQAALQWFHPTYTEHDLTVGDGIDGLRARVSNASGIENLEIHRILVDGNYVVLHSSDAKTASFDVFLFDGDLIVEHWQNAQPLSTPNASGRTLVDGTREISGRGETDLEANKAIMTRVGRTFADGGPYEELRGYYINDFVQHSSYMGDGFDALMGIVGEPATGARHVSINHLMLAEGDFVFTVSEDRAAGGTTAYFDFFRMKDGKIVEHWDTVQEVPARSDWKNNNGKF